MGSSSAFTCSSIRHICVKVDFRSAFSTTERERMVEAFANDTELNDMHRYMESVVYGCDVHAYCIFDRDDSHGRCGFQPEGGLAHCRCSLIRLARHRALDQLLPNSHKPAAGHDRSSTKRQTFEACPAHQSCIDDLTPAEAAQKLDSVVESGSSAISTKGGCIPAVPAVPAVPAAEHPNLEPTSTLAGAQGHGARLTRLDISSDPGVPSSANSDVVAPSHPWPEQFRQPWGVIGPDHWQLMPLLPMHHPYAVGPDPRFGPPRGMPQFTGSNPSANAPAVVDTREEWGPPSVSYFMVLVNRHGKPVNASPVHMAHDRFGTADPARGHPMAMADPSKPATGGGSWWNWAHQPPPMMLPQAFPDPLHPGYHQYHLQHFQQLQMPHHLQQQYHGHEG